MSLNRSADYSVLDDGDLLILRANGDTAAEETLVLRYTKAVYFHTRTCYREGWERSDFVQEGMLGLIRAIREFDASKGSPFAPYCSVCIKNAIYAALRTSLTKKNAAMNGYVSLHALNNLLAEDDMTERVAEEDELSRALAKITETLSSFEKKVLSAWLSGYSVSETAKALGKPLKSVENALTRVKSKAKSIYSGANG